jgi:outer membrane protein TolC
MTVATNPFCRYRRTWAFATAALATCAAFAQSGSAPLSVEDAVKDGLEKNPQAAAARAGTLAALANYRALAVPTPITLGASHVQGTSSAPTINGTTNDTFIDVGDTLDLSGQRRYQAAGARSTYRSTLYQYQETLLGLEQQIRDAYWSLAAAQAQTRIADVSLKEAERVYDLTVKQFQAGASPKGDVVRSSIDVANAKQTLIAAQGAERTALLAFNTLLAKPPTTPEVLADDLAADTAGPPAAAMPELKDLNTQAHLNRPLLKSAQEQSKAAEYAVRQADAAHLPDFSIDYDRSLTTSIDAVVIGISFPLLDFGSVDQSVKSAKLSRKQAEAQEDLTRRQVEQQVAQARSDLDAAVQAAASYKKEILEPSETLLDMARLGYQQGATGILPVMDAESTIRSARVGYVNALLAIYKAQDEVLAATGTRASGSAAAVTNGIKP